MLTVEHDREVEQHFYNLTSIKRYARQLLEGIGDACDALSVNDPHAHRFFMALLQRHPDACSLTHHLKDLCTRKHTKGDGGVALCIVKEVEE